MCHGSPSAQCGSMSRVSVCTCSVFFLSLTQFSINSKETRAWESWTSGRNWNTVAVGDGVFFFIAMFAQNGRIDMSNIFWCHKINACCINVDREDWDSVGWVCSEPPWTEHCGVGVSLPNPWMATTLLQLSGNFLWQLWERLLASQSVCPRWPSQSWWVDPPFKVKRGVLPAISRWCESPPRVLSLCLETEMASPLSWTLMDAIVFTFKD